MDRIERLRAWIDAHRDLALDLLRIYLGFALFAKGISFIQQGTALMESVRSAQIGFAEGVIARYVIIAHLGGGLLLGVGMVTRLAAAVQVPVLVGAVFFVNGPEGLFTRAMTLELAVLVLVLLLLYTVIGGGRLSLDSYVFRHEARARASSAARPTDV